MPQTNSSASGTAAPPAKRTATVKSVQVTIPTERDLTLAGTLDLPGDATVDTAEGTVTVTAAGTGGPLPTAIVAHCFTCNKASPGVSRISKTLARHGLASLRIDFAGLGKSEGDFARSSLDTNVDDIVASARWLDNHGAAPQLLVGHSLGGNAVLRAGALIESVRAVATVGTPHHPRFAAATISDAVTALGSAAGLREVKLPTRPISIGVELLHSLAEYDPEAVFQDLASIGMNQSPGLGVSLLFVHSPLDQTVPFQHALDNMASAEQPASLLSVPEVDHLLTWKGAGTRVGELIATWADSLVER